MCHESVNQNWKTPEYKEIELIRRKKNIEIFILVIV
jgi:hypothetical protein